MSKLNTFENLLIHEIKAIHSADAQMANILPKMTQLVASNGLRRCFEQRSRQIESRLMSLEHAMDHLGISPRSKCCKAMKAITGEVHELPKRAGASTIRDAQLVVIAQKMTHHSICTYSAAETLAYVIGNDDVSNILRRNLRDEIDHHDCLVDLAVILYTDTETNNQYTAKPILAIDLQYCYAH